MIRTFVANVTEAPQYLQSIGARPFHCAEELDPQRFNPRRRSDRELLCPLAVAGCGGMVIA
jgi:hypothetical protein